jgi:hypothetical protein
MNTGFKRLAVVAVTVWVAGNLLVTSDSLKVFSTYPMGGPDWTCERAFSAPDKLADCRKRVGVGLLGGYQGMVLIHQEDVYEMGRRILLWPLLLYAVFLTARWIRQGFRNSKKSS